MAARHFVQCHLRADRNDGPAHDKQCYRIRNGNCGTGRPDHDLAGHDAERAADGGLAKDTGNPDLTSGVSDTGHFRVYEKA